MVKQTATEHYIGSMREAKRAAYIAGAEAILDLLMKRADALAKRLDGPFAQQAGQMFTTFAGQMHIEAIKQVIARTPYEPQVEDRPFSRPAVETPKE